MANVEDAVSSRVDLASAISRYRDVLQYAGSEVNTVFDSLGCDNEIVISTADQRMGFNRRLSVAQVGRHWRR